MITNRRKLIITGASVAGASIAFPSLVWGQAQFKMKCANIVQADHPLNVRLVEASAKIKEKTNGQVDITIFPSNQLGTDADMLSQVRAGAIDIFVQSGLILGTLVPVAGINGIGFAFSDYSKVWQAMDGPLGKHIQEAFLKSNLIAFDKMWDNGFRSTLTTSKPIRTPDDLKGFKIRVPPSPLWTALFKSLGAAPVSIPWGDTYSALQTKMADGIENALATIYFSKMYEVSKNLSYTNHMWDGFWTVANKKSMEALPASARDIVVREFNEAAVRQRVDVAKLNGELASTLAAKGVQFTNVDRAPFQEKLRQSGFYGEWKRRMGEEAWSLLEGTAGKLT
ncbi:MULTISPECIES: TRAP transporter substrate-binding protein [unclassified Herbaspirillum]|uniref:TRAP transporter substrate-binding protein n=1 Tax=unclassified Herbaspirillum TaxID=2624150 RepID=UPI000E2F103E|nr:MULTISPECIES: TRAP transporter substrate-binding protein [unclassified Herbaspirillum]RFB70860.1 TRAP transporter substrate-binding protein [Herbaspirillum sp. 3R-3a1]TFI08616.1 TRAP transporter substrate-binding protein [Herbaspirillum sp. 3R11]TFI15031.1 TRAP transporter substrate-binding protein [Herbaspirillum sp. 3R-11]TFI25409.1 TRAP transporter substrate-binding protein [Herbaspirillum sp. 3C11]